MYLIKFQLMLKKQDISSYVSSFIKYLNLKQLTKCRIQDRECQTQVGWEHDFKAMLWLWLYNSTLYKHECVRSVTR